MDIEISRYMRDLVTMKIYDEGDVSVIFSDYNEDDLTDDTVRVLGCKISDNGKKISTFGTLMDFKSDSKRLML